MLEWFKNFIRRLIPYQTRRWLLHPMVVPKDYAREISISEEIHLMRHENRGLDDEYWAAALRKYAHIIDKGLQRCDCEPGHSGAFYKQAKECLGMIKSEEMLRDPSIVWARDKIAAYEHLQVCSQTVEETEPFIKTVCQYDPLIDAIKSRRSIRSFSNNHVPREVVQKIIDVVNWAPSSCNRQTTKIFIAGGDELIKACVDANNGATGFSGKISFFMSFCADLRAYDMPQELTLPVLDVSLGVQNCCLAAHSLGVGVALLNWTHHSKEQDLLLRKALSIPSYYRIVTNAVLGYPEHGAPQPSRKGANFTYDFR